jgi:hypothetical protein
VRFATNALPRAPPLDPGFTYVGTTHNRGLERRETARTEKNTTISINPVPVPNRFAPLCPDTKASPTTITPIAKPDLPPVPVQPNVSSTEQNKNSNRQNPTANKRNDADQQNKSHLRKRDAQDRIDTIRATKGDINNRNSNNSKPTVHSLETLSPTQSLILSPARRWNFEVSLKDRMLQSGTKPTEMKSAGSLTAKCHPVQPARTRYNSFTPPSYQLAKRQPMYAYAQTFENSRKTLIEYDGQYAETLSTTTATHLPLHWI